MEKEEHRCAEVAIHILDAAFAKQPIPHPDIAVDPVDPHEIQWIRWQFAGKHWHDVKFDPNQWYTYLTFQLSEEGFRYYLPALLRSTLEHRSEGLAFKVVCNFRLGSNREEREEFMNRHLAILAPLSDEQKKAIFISLRCISEFVSYEEDEPQPWPETPEERADFAYQLGIAVDDLPLTAVPIDPDREDPSESLEIVATALRKMIG